MQVYKTQERRLNDQCRKTSPLQVKSSHNIHIEQEGSVSSTTDTTKRDFSLLKSGCYTPQEPRGAHQWKLNIF